MNTERLLSIIIEAGSFIAAFAAIAAAAMMFTVTRKFGTGILASGFQSIAVGVLLIALGIILDAISSYLQISGEVFVTAIVIGKEILFVAGTYIIVIGSKKTGDKLESLTK